MGRDGRHVVRAKLDFSVVEVGDEKEDDFCEVSIAAEWSNVPYDGVVSLEDRLLLRTMENVVNLGKEPPGPPEPPEPPIPM